MGKAERHLEPCSLLWDTDHSRGSRSWVLKPCNSATSSLGTEGSFIGQASNAWSFPAHVSVIPLQVFCHWSVRASVRGHLPHRGTHHLGLILAFLPHVTQHVPQLGLLLVHLIQAVLGVLLLSLKLLQTAGFPV